MSLAIKKESVNQKITRNFGISFVELMQECLKKDMPLVEVAEITSCSVNTLNRVMGRIGFKYDKDMQVSMLVERDEFKSNGINPINIFSRNWNNKKELNK